MVWISGFESSSLFESESSSKVESAITTKA